MSCNNVIPHYLCFLVAGKKLYKSCDQNMPNRENISTGLDLWSMEVKLVFLAVTDKDEYDQDMGESSFSIY